MFDIHYIVAAASKSVRFRWLHFPAVASTAYHVDSPEVLSWVAPFPSVQCTYGDMQIIVFSNIRPIFLYLLSIKLLEFKSFLLLRRNLLILEFKRTEEHSFNSFEVKQHIVRN